MGNRCFRAQNSNNFREADVRLEHFNYVRLQGRQIQGEMRNLAGQMTLLQVRIMNLENLLRTNNHMQSRFADQMDTIENRIISEHSEHNE